MGRSRQIFQLPVSYYKIHACAANATFPISVQSFYSQKLLFFFYVFISFCCEEIISIAIQKKSLQGLMQKETVFPNFVTACKEDDLKTLNILMSKTCNHLGKDFSAQGISKQFDICFHRNRKLLAKSWKTSKWQIFIILDLYKTKY